MMCRAGMASTSFCPCTGPALAALLVVLLCFDPSLHTHFLAAAAAATDTLRPGESITGNLTLVSRGGNFELGFFSPGNSRNWFLGIWFHGTPNKTVVWVANRETPLDSSMSSELTISGAHGDLVLLNGRKIPVWSSPSSSFTSKNANSTLVGVLLDTGNFVLKDGEGDIDVVVWQSFDHPTDTLLPGQRLGYNKTEGRHWFFSSWRNWEDPSPGLFSADVDPRGLPQNILVWNKTRTYWTSGLWNDRTRSFAAAPEMMALHEYNINYFSSENASYFTYSKQYAGVFSRSWVDVSGQWRCERWSEGTQSWVKFNFLPRDPCDVYSGCGPFGICSARSDLYCTCPPGFRPRFVVEWGLGDHTGGCIREIQVECGSRKGAMEVGFQLIPHIRPLPNGSVPLVASSAEECELACLRDCLCTAYSYDNDCLVWKGDLLNMKQIVDVGDGEQSASIHLRLAASGSSNHRGKEKMKIIIVLCAVAGVIAVVCGICGVWRRQVRQLRKQTLATKDLLVQFRYKEIKSITRNFSEKLGEGGFGSVYRGVLPDSSVVAVKKLKNLSQGEKQFRMEVRAMGAVHHVNILRLRGFCCEGTKRLLVYDYMPSGSLDSYLSPKNSVCLDWNKRYQIALGTARGLLYLHENCREHIIHCDIKPENILLDEKFCPKVADFGMAKLVRRDFSRVLTTMRGTIGYLAPEWLSGVHITPKVDIFSFGMMLFEIISGRRNGGKLEFLLWAIRNVNHHGILNFQDVMGGVYPVEEQLRRACKVACWCIQDCENDRPSMGQVVQVLEGALEMEEPPIPGLVGRFGFESDPSSISYSQDMPLICSLN